MYAVYLGFDRDEVGIGIERLTSRPECLRLISIFKRERAARPAAVRVWLLGQDNNQDTDFRLRPLPRLGDKSQMDELASCKTLAPLYHTTFLGTRTTSWSHRSLLQTQEVAQTKL